MDLLKRAKQVFDIEAKAVLGMKDTLNGDFRRAVEIIRSCKGRVVVTGMGKAGIIGQKLSATLASTGTPSLFLHSAEAIHGDLGRVTREDAVVILSNSGETDEVRRLLPILKKMGTNVVAVTGNVSSSLAKYSDAVLNTYVHKEACPLGLAPTSSTTAMLAMCDALAVCLVDLRNFREQDFAFYHPGGALGKRLLLKVEDIMRKGSANPVVTENTRVSAVLLKITHARAGSASVVDAKGRLSGIFTDGDLRRNLESGLQITELPVKKVMTADPVRVKPQMLVAEAVRLLQEKKIDELPVVDDRSRPVGLLDVQDLLKAGLI